MVRSLSKRADDNIIDIKELDKKELYKKEPPAPTPGPVPGMKPHKLLKAVQQTASQLHETAGKLITEIENAIKLMADGEANPKSFRHALELWQGMEEVFVEVVKDATEINKNATEAKQEFHAEMRDIATTFHEKSRAKPAKVTQN